MSTATWGEPELHSDETLPLSLLKRLLEEIMRQFGTQGACIALLDESIGQMVLHLHVGLRASGAPAGGPSTRSVPINRLSTRVLLVLLRYTMLIFGEGARSMNWMSRGGPFQVEANMSGLRSTISQVQIGQGLRRSLRSIFLFHRMFGTWKNMKWAGKFLIFSGLMVILLQVLLQHMTSSRFRGQRMKLFARLNVCCLL